MAVKSRSPLKTLIIRLGVTVLDVDYVIAKFNLHRCPECIDYLYSLNSSTKPEQQ